MHTCICCTASDAVQPINWMHAIMLMANRSLACSVPCTRHRADSTCHGWYVCVHAHTCTHAAARVQLTSGHDHYADVLQARHVAHLQGSSNIIRKRKRVKRSYPRNQDCPLSMLPTADSTMDCLSSVDILSAAVTYSDARITTTNFETHEECDGGTGDGNPW